ncbi:MAG: hypothetical protein N3D20_01855 [Candidatus Pacearchaeota archaeon]|nr:hypothetical protein [Candidatus Pacearchaeota archaeon]
MVKKKAQLKMQEMAFVLVAIMIFFSLAIMIYLVMRTGSLKESAEELRRQEVQALSLKLADSPEFSWSKCSGCIDIEKVIVLKDRRTYRNFWGVDYLMIERVYPNYTKRECTRSTYPDCDSITLINNSYYGTPMATYVALCFYDEKGYNKCELGRVYISEKEVK